MTANPGRKLAKLTRTEQDEWEHLDLHSAGIRLQIEGLQMVLNHDNHLRDHILRRYTVPDGLAVFVDDKGNLWESLPDEDDHPHPHPHGD